MGMGMEESKEEEEGGRRKRLELMRQRTKSGRALLAAI